jgi:hypothetical protein
MPIDEGLKKILKIIAKKSNFKTENSVFDNAIVEESGLPKEEAYRYLSQLEMIELIEIGTRPSGSDRRLINITKLGIEECSVPTDRDIA